MGKASRRLKNCRPAASLLRSFGRNKHKRGGGANFVKNKAVLIIVSVAIAVIAAQFYYFGKRMAEKGAREVDLQARLAEIQDKLDCAEGEVKKARESVRAAERARAEAGKQAVLAKAARDEANARLSSILNAPPLETPDLLRALEKHGLQPQMAGGLVGLTERDANFAFNALEERGACYQALAASDALVVAQGHEKQALVDMIAGKDAEIAGWVKKEAAYLEGKGVLEGDAKYWRSEASKANRRAFWWRAAAFGAAGLAIYEAAR